MIETKDLIVFFDRNKAQELMVCYNKRIDHRIITPFKTGNVHNIHVYYRLFANFALSYYFSMENWVIQHYKLYKS